MKKYFTAFFLFCLSLIIIDNVYALDGDNWVIGIPHPVIARLWSCSSSTNCSTDKTLYSAEVTTDVGGTDYIYYPGSFYYSDSFSIPTNGIAWTYNTGKGFTKGYLYAQTTYVCLSNTSTYFVLDDYGLDTGTSYSHTNVRAIYNTSNILSGNNFVFDSQPRCQYFTTIFEATSNTKTYSIKLDTTTTVNARYHLMGYETTLLGQADLVTNESLTNAITGSGLATAQNVQDLADAQQQVKDEIVQNQNDNTQQTIDSQKVCKSYDKVSISTTNSYLNINGFVTSSSGWGITDYIDITGATIDVLQELGNTTSTAFCFYNVNKSLISCRSNYNIGTVSIPSDASFVRFSINSSLNKPQFKVCKNGNQAIAQGQEDINNTLNNDDVPDSSDMFDDFNDMLPSNNTISSLIALPITLYTKILNSINSTCTSISLGSLYGINLVMPCIDIGSYLGSTLWGVIDLIMSGMFVLVIAKKMVKSFEGFTSLKEGDVINND